MKLKKTPDISPVLSEIVEEQRGQLVSITAMMIEACQQAIKKTPEIRRFFGLEMVDSDMLREASLNQIGYISQRCLYPFRPNRSFKEMLAQGQSSSESSLTAHIAGADTVNSVFADLRIMWLTYVFSAQRLVNEHKGAWLMLGVSLEDAATLSTALPNALRAMASNGPYVLTPSACLRGLLGPRRVLRPDELLRRCARDMSVTQL